MQESILPKKSENHDLELQSKNIDLIKENNELRTKIAFSLGALEGIGYLLKNDDQKNLDHIRITINRVIEDLRNDLR
jgi:hypothetical protein